MLVMMMGLAELTMQSYLQSILTGAVQKASRDSTLEGNNTPLANTTVDNKVMTAVGKVLANLTWDTPSRVNYSHFADIGPEYYFDSNNNGVYDSATECYLDSNNNGVWDANPGATGQGTANAVVVYQMGFTYNRLFPIYQMIGWPATQHLTAKTTVKNQPYRTTATSDNVKKCPS